MNFTNALLFAQCFHVHHVHAMFAEARVLNSLKLKLVHFETPCKCLELNLGSL